MSINIETITKVEKKFAILIYIRWPCFYDTTNLNSSWLKPTDYRHNNSLEIIYKGSHRHNFVCKGAKLVVSLPEYI